MTAAGPAAAGVLYDARRGAYYTRPAVHGWLHMLCYRYRAVATTVNAPSIPGRARPDGS